MPDNSDTGGALGGKRIVIIGASSGFGRSAAQACIGAGARVAGVAPDEAAVAEGRAALGDDVVWVAGDATEPDTAERAVGLAVSRWGGIDGLYHVAGGSGRKWGDGPCDAMSGDGWARTIALNQTSVFYSNRAALRALIAGGRGGAILNLSSTLAYAPSPKHFAAHAYASAKAGVIGLTRSLASYYAPQNIRVNAIAPGCSDTPMAARAKSNAEIQAFLTRKQPLDGGRMGRADDLDAAVVFLLSDGARFITGQVLAIDGGWCVSDGTPRE